MIEILVVSIIVAILSAVAIPLYSGYITGQRQAAALAVAQTAAITASSLIRRGKVVDNTTLPAAVSLPNATQFAITVNGRIITVIENSNPDNPVQATANF